MPMTAAERDAFCANNPKRTAWKSTLFEIPGPSWPAYQCLSVAKSANILNHGSSTLVHGIYEMADTIPIGNQAIQEEGLMLTQHQTSNTSETVRHDCTISYTPPAVSSGITVPLLGVYLRLYFCNIPTGYINFTPMDATSWNWITVEDIGINDSLVGLIFDENNQVVSVNRIRDDQWNRHPNGAFFPLAGPVEEYNKPVSQIKLRVNFDPVYGPLTRFAVYASIHFVYAFNFFDVGTSGALAKLPPVDWIKCSPTPVLVKADGGTLTADIKTPKENTDYLHKVRYVLLDEDGEYRTDSEAVIDVENGGLLDASTKTLTQTFSRDLFKKYPNSNTIYGYAQLWTYYNATIPLNNKVKGELIPVEGIFQLELPATDENIPVAGKVTATILSNGCGVTNRYVQGKSGVRLKMATPSAKLDATVRQMRVSYGDKTVFVTEADEDGGYTFELARLHDAGKVTFVLSVIDSRGMTSAAKQVTITVQPYEPPVLSECELYRVDENGTPYEFGEAAVIKPNVTISSVGGKNSITGIQAAIVLDEPNQAWEDAETVTLQNNTSRAFSSELDGAKRYRVRLQITDKVGDTTIAYKALDTAPFGFHLRQGGNGIGFGEAARVDQAVTIADTWDVRVYGDSLRDLLIPIGTVMMFGTLNGDKPYDPADIYTGTVWQRITDRMLVASSASDSANHKYLSGEIGGDEHIRLDPSEIPQLPVTFVRGAYAFNSGIATPPNREQGFTGVREGWGDSIGEWGGTDFLAGTVANKGNSIPTQITHIPPYYVVDVWMRIA